MEFLKRNWEKFAFVTALVLLGLVGYRLYLDVQIRSDDERVNKVVKNVQESLDREPDTSVSEPPYSSRFKKQWSPIQGTVAEKNFMVYMPPLIRPELDRTPDVRCEFPGVSQLQASSSPGQVKLNWQFEQLQDSDTVVAVPPGEVVIQRRKSGTDQWTDVTSFSGTEENQYRDENVESRTGYEYRLQVKRGNQPCEDQQAEWPEGNKVKTSTAVSVNVKSDIELVLKSASQDSALILIRQFVAGQENPKEEDFWFDVGEQIKKNGFNTPFTLTDVQNDAQYSYLTLTEETKNVGKEGGPISIGLIRRNTIRRPRIVYKDERGNVYRKWQVRETDPTNFYPSSGPAPWEKSELKAQYDKFRTEAEELPWGEIPEAFRIELNEEDGQSGTEEGGDGTGNEDNAESGTDQEQ